MLLSVIVPIYNVSEYLEECIDSIINQSLKDMEIILVNDCSPDNNDELICSKYIEKDSRIKYIKHKKNKGVGETRNTGIKSATGKYIAFVDPDDFLIDMNIYEKAINILEDNDNINFVGFNHKFFENNKFTPRVLELDLNYEKQESQIDISKQLTSIAVWNKVYRLKDIIDNNIVFKLRVVEDLMFNTQYYSIVKPIYKFINDYGYAYRIREGSISYIFDPKKQLPSYVEILEYINNNGLYDIMYDYMFNVIMPEDFFRTHLVNYIKDDNYCCKEDFLKLLSYYRVSNQQIDRLIYKGKYKIIVDNKEKFQKLFPEYKVKSKLYYKLHRVLYHTFRGIMKK